MDRWEWDDAVAAHVADRFRGWTDCTPRGDMDALRTFLHDDFVYVSVFGHRYDKEEYIALADSVTEDAVYTIHRVGARVRDGVAEVDGEYHVAAVTAGGDDLSAHTRFTACWVLQGGEWVALTHHGTRYDPGA